jgi:hypothetical protein
MLILWRSQGVVELASVMCALTHDLPHYRMLKGVLYDLL